VRRGSLRSLAPAGAIWLTQAVWFGIPFLLRHANWSPFQALDFDSRTYYFTWIALAHALQYLWVTTYYARAGSDWSGTGRYYVKALLAGKALFVLPIIAVAPFGVLSHDAGLALLVSSAVNVHHFILDGAIWKLRSSRIASVLIRSGRDADDAVEPRGSLRGPLWGVAAACIAAAFFVLWTDVVTVPRHMRAHDWAAAARALDRIAWLGFDHEKKRAQLASNFLAVGHVDAAAAQARKSLDLHESSEGWRLLGDAQLRSRAHEPALASYERALALEPDSLPLLVRLAQANAATGRTDRALEILQRADGLVAHDDAAARATIAGLQARLAARVTR
jgi:hypothetical protein